MKITRGLLPVLLFLSMLLAACGGLAGEPVIVATIPPQPTRPSVNVAALLAEADKAQGAALFAEHCTDCHGTQGKGDGALVASGQVTAPRDFTNPATLEGISAADWYAVIRDGRLQKLMPPWGEKFTPEQIAAVTLYVYELSSAPAVAANNAAAVVPASTEETTPSQAAATAIPPVEIVGIVSGSVAHGTVGGVVPDDLMASLEMMNATNQPVTLATAPVLNGSFTFEAIPLRTDQVYTVSVWYGDTFYFSETLSPQAGATTLELPVMIYEKTADSSVLQISLLLTQIEKQGNNIAVAQIVQYENTSDKTFMQDTPTENGLYPTVEIYLPEGVTLNPDGMLPGYILSADGRRVQDTAPIFPGERHTMHVAYSIPFNDSAVLDFKVPYAMNNQAEIMLAPNAFKVVSDQFQFFGTQQFASGLYDDYIADPVAPGETLHLQLLPAPPPAAELNPNIPLAFGLAIAGVGMMVFSGVLFIHSNRMMKLQMANQHVQVEMLAKDIAELDARHQAGKINDKKYQQQRSALKKRLADLMSEKPQQN